MLALLLERHQTYADIGSLLDLDVEAVRARARAALTEIAGEDPDREVGLTDYLLGQADPIGRADAARHLQADPDANALARKLISQLRLLAPNAELPSPPPTRGQPTGAAAATGQPAESVTAGSPSAPPPSPSGGAGSSLSPRQRRLIAALIGGAALVAIVVLIAAGAFSGGGGNESDTTAASNGGASGSGGGQLTRAVLSPQSGSKASGVVIFGRVRNVPVLEVRAIDLMPTGKKESYSVWLYRSNKVTLRIGGVRVGKTGRILTQIPIPTQALSFVSNGTFDSIVITKTADAAFQAEVAQAKKEKRLPRLTGAVILRGKITGPAVQQASTGATGATGATGGQGG
jgi:hypothetical protein